MYVDLISDTLDIAVIFNLVHQAGSIYQLVDLDTGAMMEDENGEAISFEEENNYGSDADDDM